MVDDSSYSKVDNLTHSHMDLHTDFSTAEVLGPVSSMVEALGPVSAIVTRIAAFLPWITAEMETGPVGTGFTLI